MRIRAAGVELDGDLTVPASSRGLVVFAHGSGSSRQSPRNRLVARGLQERGLATLLMDLLTAEEERVDVQTRELRFDIPRLAARLVGARQWLGKREDTAALAVGYFGSSTGGGAALVAAGADPDAVAAIVSRGGRPDLAGDALPEVRAPTLLIVGELDEVVLKLNREAMARMRAETALEVVPGATHLFAEPGALEVVTGLAADWFLSHLGRSSPARDSPAP